MWPQQAGESCPEPPSSRALLPTSGQCRCCTCPLNERMKFPNNDDDGVGGEEAGTHRALATCQALLQASVRINSFNPTTGP